MKVKLPGIPAISILVVLTMVVSGFIVWASLLPAYAEVIYLSTTTLILCVIPLIYFAIAYLYRKMQGVPIELQFMEIPPD